MILNLMMETQIGLKKHPLRLSKRFLEKIHQDVDVKWIDPMTITSLTMGKMILTVGIK